MALKRWKRTAGVAFVACTLGYMSWRNIRSSLLPQILIDGSTSKSNLATDHAVVHFRSLKPATSLALQTATASGITTAKQSHVAVVVPGFGSLERLPLLFLTLNALKKSTDNSSVSFACIVYVWNEALLQVTSEALKHCTVEYSKGLWTNHMMAVGSSNATARIIERASHVVLLLDDIDAQAISLPYMIQAMEEARFDIAGPSIPEGLASCAARSHCLAHLTGHVDILFTMFTRPMWACWQRHIDININAVGWGFDLTMADLCYAQVGIIDHQIAYHSPDCAEADKSKCKGSTYDLSSAYGQMWAWIKYALNFTDDQQAIDYHYLARVHRPLQLPYCAMLRFHAILHDTATDVDALEWHSLVEGLNETGYITTRVEATPHNHKESVELVSVNAQFGLSNDNPGQNSVAEPWVGFVHSGSFDVPPHLQNHRRAVMSLMDILETNAFRQSAPHCIALFAFTATMAEMASEQLIKMGTTNIKVCSMRYPLPVLELNSVFDPEIDLKTVLSKSSGLVLLNPKHDIRVATFHQLKTKRQKVWLVDPSDMDTEWVNNATRLELEAESIARDVNVQLKSVESRHEYSQFVRRNIVVVDGWSDGSVDAAVWALAFQAPFIIRRLNGAVEYLGENYPLFFTNVSQVQDLFDNNESLLESKLREAHLYLKRLRTNASALSGTTAMLVDDMLNCTLQAMAQWKQP